MADFFSAQNKVGRYHRCWFSDFQTPLDSGVKKLAPRGAWLRQKSCQEISCSRSVGIKEVGFV